MLDAAEPMAFLPSQDLDRSEQFFAGALGLTLESRSPFASVFRCGALALRVTKVDGLRPQPFTVFGWVVEDIHGVLDQLRHHGVEPVVYDGVEQDAQGVWTTPNGDRIAWFHDPDGNVLSLTAFAAADD